MGFPIGDPFSIRSSLLAGVQTCQLFGKDLMTTRKRSKETNSETLLQQGISEHIFYGDLVYKFKRVVGK